MVVEAKQRPCADCGIQYPYYVMDFDNQEGVAKKFMVCKVHNATEKTIFRRNCEV